MESQGLAHRWERIKYREQGQHQPCERGRRKNKRERMKTAIKVFYLVYNKAGRKARGNFRRRESLLALFVGVGRL